MKYTKELKYVHYLLTVKNQTIKCRFDRNLATIRRRVLDRERKYDDNYRPIYLNPKGEDVEMQKNTAYFEVFFKMKQLSFNPNSLQVAYILLCYLQYECSSIQNLITSIYKLREDTEEFINLNTRLMQIL